MKIQPRRVRLAIFGVGMHFQETYTTALKRPEIRELVEVVWVADIADKKDLVLRRCLEAGQQPEFVGITSFIGQALPNATKKTLDTTLASLPVDAVLVSTTPEQHRAYAGWAMNHHLPVLLDKPITSRQNAANNEDEAMGILEDWKVLNSLSENTNTLLMVNSHRRFHPAYKLVGELLKTVSDSYGFGVTSISSFNSDGQWRMPNEMLDIDYHGFNMGNGVLSHFGYHYLDLAASWYKKGTPPQRRADSAAVSSSFLRASEYVKQVSAADAGRALQLAGQPKPPNDNAETTAKLEAYGEVDSFGSIEMLKDDVLTAHISVQMLHSGFSQRAWTKPATNLYKENGRVRWENHLIQQGPLHAIEIRSFQAVQPSHTDPTSGLPRWGLGGSDQLEINIFRNKLIGGKPLETINISDLLDTVPQDDVIHEDVKAKVLQLFISLVAKQIGIFESLKSAKVWRAYVQSMLDGDDQDLSLINTHQPTVAFMAASYASAARRITHPSSNERIKVPLQW